MAGKCVFPTDYNTIDKHFTKCDSFDKAYNELQIKSISEILE